MINARDEFLDHTKGRVIKCAMFNFRHRYDEEPLIFSLPVGYTDAQRKKFLRALDFEYEDGYGSQMLFGTIWYEDGTWSERDDYDGNEWWILRVVPEIPEEMR